MGLLGVDDIETPGTLREVTKAKALAPLDTLKNPGFKARAEAAIATKADADYAP